MWVYWSSYLNNGSWTIAYYPTELDIIIIVDVSWIFVLSLMLAFIWELSQRFLLNRCRENQVPRWPRFLPGEISGDPVMGAIPIYTQSIDSNDVTGIPKHNVPKNRKLFGGNSNVFSPPRKTWVNDPIWRRYSSDGWRKPPPRRLFGCFVWKKSVIRVL